MNSWRAYLGRIICTALGLVAAIMFLTLGFAKTILILLCCTAGYAIGTCGDRGIRISELLSHLRDRWR